MNLISLHSNMLFEKVIGTWQGPSNLASSLACPSEQVLPGNITHRVYHTEKSFKIYVPGLYMKRQMFFLLHRAELIYALKGSRTEMEIPHSSICIPQLSFDLHHRLFSSSTHREPMHIPLSLLMNVFSGVCLL